MNTKNKHDTEANMLEPDEAFEGFGFSMARYGRLISSQTHRSPEEQRELMTRLKKFGKELPDISKDIVKKIENNLSGYNSFDIIANISVANLIINPDTYKEYAHMGLSAYVEYIALITLKHAFNEGKEQIIDGTVIESFQKLLEDVFQNAIWMEFAKTADPDRVGPPTSLEELQFRMFINELLVRNPGYAHHLYEILRGLFKPYDQILLKNAGFDVYDAINITEGIKGLITNRLYDKMENSRRRFDLLRSLVRKYRKTKSIPKDEENDLDTIKYLSKFTDKDLRLTLKRLSAGFAFFKLGDIYSFSPQELSLDSGISVEIIESFLEYTKIEFGDIPSDYYIPSPTHPLRLRPIIKHENRYLCPSLILLDWAINPVIENILREIPGKTWQGYSKTRHNYLLDKSLDLLQSTMPESNFESSLEYKYFDDGEEKTAELDALGVFDSVLFIIEVKGGGLTDPARRGAPARLERTLKDIIGEAHSQGIRAKSYVESTINPTFVKVKNRSSLNLDMRKIKDIILMSVSMESLGALTSHISACQEVALFSKNDLPWTVNIYDLKVICDLIDIPAMFPHYVKRRIRVAEQEFLSAFDELDFFGYYLSEGLYFESKDEIAPANGIELLTFTTEIDNYYLYKLGAKRKPAPKPTQMMPKEFIQLLRSIDRLNIDNRVLVQMGLLDLGFDTRNKLLRIIRQTNKRHKKDGQLHDATMVGGQEGGWGITYAIGSNPDETEKKLKHYCRLKKNESRASVWYGICGVRKKSKKVSNIIYLD